jgi:hypothetical protein
MVICSILYQTQVKITQIRFYFFTISMSGEVIFIWPPSQSYYFIGENQVNLW